MADFNQSQEAQIYIEVWNFHKRYFDVRTDENIWKQILSDAGKIYAKNNQSKFCRDMLAAVILLLNYQATQNNGGKEGNDMTDFTFEILEHYGVVSDEKSGLTKQLNLIAWSGNGPMFDLRPWKTVNGTKQPCKGLTLTLDELKVLKAILNGMACLKDAID